MGVSLLTASSSSRVKIIGEARNGRQNQIYARDLLTTVISYVHYIVAATLHLTL